MYSRRDFGKMALAGLPVAGLPLARAIARGEGRGGRDDRGADV